MTDDQKDLRIKALEARIDAWEKEFGEGKTPPAIYIDGEGNLQSRVSREQVLAVLGPIVSALEEDQRLLQDETQTAETVLRKILGVVQRYLPPDGPDIKQAMSEIIALVDPWPLASQSATPADNLPPPDSAYWVNHDVTSPRPHIERTKAAQSAAPAVPTALEGLKAIRLLATMYQNSSMSELDFTDRVIEVLAELPASQSAAPAVPEPKATELFSTKDCPCPNGPADELCCAKMRILREPAAQSADAVDALLRSARNLADNAVADAYAGDTNRCEESMKAFYKVLGSISQSAAHPEGGDA